MIRRARLHGLLHRVVDVEDHALRAVCAICLLVLAFDDGAGFQHVVHVVAPDAVEVEVGRLGLTYRLSHMTLPSAVPTVLKDDELQCHNSTVVFWLRISTISSRHDR